MKKTYLTPNATVVTLPTEDFILTSGMLSKKKGAGFSYYTDDDINVGAPGIRFGETPFGSTFD